MSAGVVRPHLTHSGLDQTGRRGVAFVLMSDAGDHHVVCATGGKKIGVDQGCGRVLADLGGFGEEVA
ncbi:MAG: hypothetical protein ACYDGR_13965 [Candidatus Dormibacteria bacterium]